jgi:SAM-dependent methyltransferase
MNRIIEQLKSNRILIFFILLTLTLGTISNRFLFPEDSPLDLIAKIWQRLENPAILILVPILTIINIGLRYLKWMFLLRSFGLAFPSRTIFLYYLISFIGNLTPLYFLYLIRIIPLIERRKKGILILALDILLDLLAVSLLYLSPGLAPLAALLFSVTIVSAALLRSAHANPISIQILSTLSMLFFSVTIWFLTAAGLNLTLMSFDLTYLEPVNLYRAAELLASANLKSAFSLIPAGVYVNGNSLIESLEKLSVPHDIAIYSTAIFRGMTNYLAIGLGLISLLLFRRNLRIDLHAQNHFNIIADEYGDQIPSHIREKILSRKIAVNQQYLHRPECKNGLDAGCGQGWYLERMTELGYRMKGIDFSEEQVRLARKNNPGLPEQDIRQASVTAIPFPDASFDFVYTVNVLHHLPDRAAQLKAYDEFLRVLRPGGILIIHEINVLNPLFRLYMGYIFPLINTIDEGTEIWILEKDEDLRKRFEFVGVEFFTFLPEFLPEFLLRLLTPVERWLENSPMRRYSAHYALVLRKGSAPVTSRAERSQTSKKASENLRRKSGPQRRKMK